MGSIRVRQGRYQANVRRKGFATVDQDLYQQRSRQALVEIPNWKYTY